VSRQLQECRAEDREFEICLPVRLLPPPILIHSGKMRLMRTLMVFSAVGNTDTPPQICSSVYRS